MSALAILQLEFQAHVLSGCDNERFVRSVVATRAADSMARLGVYVYAYRARLIEVLAEDFPGLRALAGANFDALCHEYVNATPSLHYNVRWYGENLSDFLRKTGPWSETPALAEMAEFEWALGLCFDAADERHVEAASLAALAPQEWPELRLRLQNTVRRLNLRWNVAAIRRAVDREEIWPQPIELAPAQTWAVWREDTTVRHRFIPADEAAALDAVENDASFAQICETLCDWHPEETVALRAATLLGQWVQDQWIARLLSVP